MGQKIREIDLRNAITERFLATGEASSAKDIAAHLDCSLTTVYARLRATHGGLPYGTAFGSVYRRPGGGKYPTEYVPSRDHLRGMVLKLRLGLVETKLEQRQS